MSTFQQARMASGLTSSAIAQAAGVSLYDEYSFEIDGPVDEEIKKKSVQALSLLTGHVYTLSDFVSAEKKRSEMKDQSIGIGNRDWS